MSIERPNKQDKLVDSALRRAKNEGLYNDIVEMSSPDLQAILIKLFTERVSTLSPSDVFRQFKENRFVQPSAIDQRVFHAFDAAFFKNLERGVDIIELSPVASLGANSVLAGISQNNVLSTVRNVEVMADTVTTLALECARRREVNKGVEPIMLCTSQREVRAQEYDESLGFFPHFKSISLVSSHTFDGEESTLSNMLTRHIRFYLRGLRDFLDSNDNFTVNQITVAISSTRIMRTLIRELGSDMNEVRRNTRNRVYDLLEDTDIPRDLHLSDYIDSTITEQYRITKMLDYTRRISTLIESDLAEEFSEVNFVIDLGRISGVGYYTDLCFNIKAENINGDTYQFVDGGETDWTKQLLQSKKERCIAGGMGSEFFLSKFNTKTK